jgi:deoxyguanosine kinase
MHGAHRRARTDRLVYSPTRGLPLPRDRRADRVGQDQAGRASRRPARRPGAALQAQLFFLLNRHRQLSALRQADLFQQSTVCDYVFDKDKIFAFLNLDDNELFIYQRLFDLLARDVPVPDLVVYLQTPTDVLLARAAARDHEPDDDTPRPDAEYLRELNEAYQHYFFHYTSTPLLVVETSQFDPEHDDEALDDLVKQVQAHTHGTRYYVPRTRR